MKFFWVYHPREARTYAHHIPWPPGYGPASGGFSFTYSVTAQGWRA